jgi:hypothetical protein
MKLSHLVILAILLIVMGFFIVQNGTSVDAEPGVVETIENSEAATSANTANKDHLFSGQKKVLDDAKAVSNLLETQLQQQKEALEAQTR